MSKVLQTMNCSYECIESHAPKHNHMCFTGHMNLELAINVYKCMKAFPACPALHCLDCSACMHNGCESNHAAISVNYAHGELCLSCRVAGG